MSNKEEEVVSDERKEEENSEQSQEDGAAAYDASDGRRVWKKLQKLCKRNKQTDDQTISDSDIIEAGFKPDTGNARSDVQPEVITRDGSPSRKTSSGKPTQESSASTTPINKHGIQIILYSRSPGYLNQSGVPDHLEYAYNNTRKGFMVIIINETFERFSPRKGADKDKDMLVKIAKQYGFEFEEISNRNQRTTIDFIERISKKDFSQYDCLIFAVSSHGEEIKDKKTGQWDHIFVSSDDEDIFTREVINLFDEKNCPTLKGKPKLFFIQACRGVGTDDGETVKVRNMPQLIKNPQRKLDRPDAKLKYSDLEDVMDEDTMQLGDKRPANNKRPDPSESTIKSGETSKTAASSDGKDVKMNVKPVKGMVSQSESEDGTWNAPDTTGGGERLPKSGDRSVDCGNDMVIVFASISGMMAWRNERFGSWMLYDLHQALNATTAPTNLLKILTRVNYKMAQKQSICKDDPSLHAKKAIAVILHRLQKKLMLTKLGNVQDHRTF